MPFDPVEKTRAFLATITLNSRVALLHDDDPDGVCSGVLVTRLLQRAKHLDLTHRQTAPHDPFSSRLVNGLITRGITHVIVCDLSIDKSPTVVKQAEHHFHILSLDHHQLLHDVNSERTTLIKPHLFWNGKDPAKYCTSKLAYDIGNAIVDLSDSEWLAMTGSISDIATEPWTDWMRTVFTKYHAEMKVDLFQTLFGKVAITINDTIAYDEKLVGDAFDTVFKAKTPQDVLNSPLKTYHDAIQAEMDKWINEFNKHAEQLPDAKLKILEIDTPYGIRSALISQLSFTHDTKNTLILWQRNGDRVEFSSRNQTGDVPLNDVMREAVAGLLETDGGGHRKAAGGHCNAKDWPDVKQRIINALTARNLPHP